MSANFRIKITDHLGNVSYIVRRNDHVWYMSGSQTPLALSNLMGDDAAETEFALLDAVTGEQARQFLLASLQLKWRNNKPDCPKVFLLA